MSLNLDLFPRPNLRCVSLSTEDVRADSDHVRAFRQLVLESEPMYPGIRYWIAEKVLPELAPERRCAYIAYDGERPIVSAVVKLGATAKICHLRVDESHQERHLGELFFAMMALRCRKSRTIHFTLPESLWDHKQAFFSSFGFRRVEESGTQYRDGDRELACSAPAALVVEQTLRKTPTLMGSLSVSGRELATQLLMSVKPGFARALMTGAKKVEVRRRFSKKWEGARVAVYATSPAAEIVGEVTIRRVVVAPPNELWRFFGHLMGCSREEFDSYLQGCSEASALVLTHPRPYLSPISLPQLSHWLGGAPRPPQSYCVIDPSDAWGKALTIANLLHGAFTYRDLRSAAQHGTAEEAGAARLGS